MLLGLLAHAAADGLAVGVASVSPSIKLAVAVGMAMVLHKGPVAFGLGTFLVSQKLPAMTVIQVCEPAILQFLGEKQRWNELRVRVAGGVQRAYCCTESSTC